MEMQGKVWGSTACLFKVPTIELHRLEIDAGGYCSEHVHRVKWNFFHVESGVLVVRVWRNGPDGPEDCEDRPPDMTVLRPGDSMSVKPGLFHRFEATRAAVVYEATWLELVMGGWTIGEDIERRTQGGVGASKDEQ